MKKSSLLLVSFVLAIIFGSMHAMAQVFYFYWTLWWFDYLMHFLAGVFIGLITLWVAYRWSIFGGARPGLLRASLIVFLPVVLIGVAWEVFEYFFGLTEATEEVYALDVAHDLLADLVGGIVAVYVGTKKRFYD